MTQPNILILMPDQLRADALGCCRTGMDVGHPVYRTPNVDRLAREGVRFTHAICNSPMCMPARASLVSGVYPHNHGIWENAGHLPADDETYAQLLQRAGYHTAYLGKIHFFPDDAGRSLIGHEDYVRARGFDDVHEVPGPSAMTKTDNYLSRRWQALGLLEPYQADFRRRAEASRRGEAAAWASPLPVDEYLDSYVGARAVEWLERYDSSHPFLLNVGFGGPHAPWDPPGAYASMYRAEDMADPLPVEQPGEWVPDYARERMAGGRGGPPVPAGGDTGGKGERARRVARERAASYGGKVTLIDDWIGRILATLDRQGLADNTLVIFLSDHGEMAGDHGRYQKSVFFEGALRVPLILRWPGGLPPAPLRSATDDVAQGQAPYPDTDTAGAARGVAPRPDASPSAGRASDALVEQIDLFPTLLEAAGAEPSKRALGRSLLPLTCGAAQPVRDAAHSELGGEIMVRTAHHKYAVDRRGRGYLIFDLQDDPGEQRNLIGHADYAALERTLREDLLTWLVSNQVQRS